MKPAARIATTLPDQDWQAAITKGATGRQVSMQRRKALSLAGRAGLATSSSTRASGRMKARAVDVAAPSKVEVGHTLAGQPVTGTLVERSRKVTGNEPGSCKSITGTEYIGGEQFDTLCKTRPAPAPSKVAVSIFEGCAVPGNKEFCRELEQVVLERWDFLYKETMLRVAKRVDAAAADLSILVRDPNRE